MVIPLSVCVKVAGVTVALNLEDTLYCPPGVLIIILRFLPAATETPVNVAVPDANVVLRPFVAFSTDVSPPSMVRKAVVADPPSMLHLASASCAATLKVSFDRVEVGGFWLKITFDGGPALTLNWPDVVVRAQVPTS